MLRDKDEDDGPPSETEEDRRQQESRAKEIRGDHCKKKKKIAFSSAVLHWSDIQRVSFQSS